MCVCVFFCSNLVVGDAPAAALRGLYSNNENGEWLLGIDRIFTLQKYRNRGFCFKCLLAMLQNTLDQQIPIQSIVVYLPLLNDFEWVGSRLVSMGFNVGNDVLQVLHIWGGCPTRSYVLHLGGKEDAVQSLQDQTPLQPTKEMHSLFYYVKYLQDKLA
jgi:hypothetical protein